MIARTQNCKTLTELRHEIRSYNCLFILVKQFGEAFTWAYGLLHVCLVPCLVLILYGAVRLNGPIAFGFCWLFMVVTSLCLVLIMALADINQRSKALVVAFIYSQSVGATLWTTAEHAIMRRECETLRELKILVGSTFYFDKPLVLTVLQNLLIQSANLLILY